MSEGTKFTQVGPVVDTVCEHGYPQSFHCHCDQMAELLASAPALHAEAERLRGLVAELADALEAAHQSLNAPDSHSEQMLLDQINAALSKARPA